MVLGPGLGRHPLECTRSRVVGHLRRATGTRSVGIERVLRLVALEEVAASDWMGSSGRGLEVMSSTTHKREVHIDAPVERVVEYVKVPEHFLAAMLEAEGKEPRDATAHLTKVSLTTDGGVGSTYEAVFRVFFITMHVVGTRTEYVPNERIVDRMSTGVTWTYTTTPDDTGTLLSLACEVSSKVPLVDKVEDALFWKGDRDLDKYLAAYKHAIEA